MLRIRRRSAATLVVTFLGTLLLISAVTFGSSAPLAHSVTGSGIAEEEVEEGVSIIFRTTIAAHQKANGNVSGNVVVNLDLSQVGVAKLITFRQNVVCMEVDDNSAWVGGIVTESNDEEVIPTGTSVITLVRDLGGNGEDIMHGEPVVGVTCEDRPEFAETVVKHGNYKVK